MMSGPHRERIYSTFSDSSRDVLEKIDHALEVGAEYLDLPIGFFTRIDGGTQEIVRAVGDHELIQEGSACPLEYSYCRRTIDLDGPLAIQDVDGSDMGPRPIQTFRLGAYIGVKVVVDEEVYGSVCFADHENRETPFSESEEMFLELLARLIGNEFERRRYERTLREQNEQLKQEKERFEGIAENSFDVLFRVDLEARFTYVSSAVERVLGYQPAALTGDPFFDLLTDPATEKAEGGYEQLLDGDPVESMELTFIDRAGAPVRLEINATPITEDGDIVGIQGVGRDITARKQRERELRLKTRAIDEADVGISIADPTEPDEPLIYANGGFERITGYDPVEAQGRNCRFLQGEKTAPEAAGRLRAALDAEESEVVELVNYRRDGTPFWNRVRVTPIFDDLGDVSHVLGFQEDVTERRRTDQLVQLLNRVLRHNLRNDMNALMGWGELLHQGDIEDVQPVGDRIEGIARGLADLSEHARELERYARTDREPKRLDPTTLVSDLATSHRQRFPDATIETAVRTDRNLCAGDEVRRALAELIENAVKHDPSENPTVTLSVEDAGEWIEVVVRDEGVGINEMEARVVDAGNETQLEHSSGLGLWLTNWIVTRYGGSFCIEPVGTAGDEGTVATVRLPALDEETTVEEARRPPTVLFS